MRAFSYARVHLKSRDKDGGHAIRFAVAEKPHAARKLHGSVL